MVMQAGFYFLSGVLPVDEALELLKGNIETTYGKKGPKIVKMNQDCVDMTVENVIKVDVPASWADTPQTGNDIGIDRLIRYREMTEGDNTWDAAAEKEPRRNEHGEYLD